MAKTLALIIIFSVLQYKSVQLQKYYKLRTYKHNMVNFWLTDENCADLNFDGLVNFYDYAIYLRLK